MLTQEYEHTSDGLRDENARILDKWSDRYSCRTCLTQPWAYGEAELSRWHAADHPYFSDEDGQKSQRPVFIPHPYEYEKKKPSWLDDEVDEEAFEFSHYKILVGNQQAYEDELYDPRNTVCLITGPTRERTPGVFGLADIVQWAGWAGTLGVGIYYVVRWVTGS